MATPSKTLLNLILTGACLTLTPALAAPRTEAPSTSPAPEGAHDFDFLNGRWTILNRRLDKRLAGSKTWIEFEAADDIQALPGGIGNEEHFRTAHWPGYVGIGLHLYDADARKWSIYWVDNRNTSGRLQPPVHGAFSRGVGTFEGEDQFDGRPIRVRFTWKVLGPNQAHWEQAFSADGGSSWETNWTMEFTRR